MPGYLDPIADSGHHGYGQADFRDGHCRTSLDALSSFFPDNGWAWIPDGSDHEGTAATTDVILIAPPAHEGDPGGFSQVPINSRGLGRFFGKSYVFWDPLSNQGGPHGSGDEDPTGNLDDLGFLIVGVPLGSSTNTTVNNFVGKFNSNTDNYFAHDFGFHDTDGLWHGAITAKRNGPLWNLDSSNSQTGQWDLDSSTIAGFAPIGGGWYFHSTAAPVTGDTMRLWAGMPDTNHRQAAFIVRINGNRLTELNTVFMFRTRYLMTLCGFQFTIQELPNQPEHNFIGSVSFICSCLNVPTEFGPQDFTVIDVDLTTITLQLEREHWLEVGAEVWITRPVADLDPVEYPYFVSSIPAKDKIRLSATKWGTELGAGSLGPWESLATIKTGIRHAVMASADLAEQPFTSVGTVLLNDDYQVNYTSDVPNPYGMEFPVISGGGLAFDVLTTANKPMIQAPYVVVTPRNNAEGRIAGRLWDAFVSCKISPRYLQTLVGDVVFQSWGKTAPGSTISYTLWIKIALQSEL